MTDVKKLTALAVLGVYVALLLLLLRPAGNGPGLVAQAGLTLATLTAA